MDRPPAADSASTPQEPASGRLPSALDPRKAELVERIKEVAEKLGRDTISRGDLKILARALRELRYAFKVFGPYRRQRKVTVFGSARTRPEAPDYQLAMEFGRQMARHDWLVVTGAASGIMEAGHRGAGREHSMGINIMLPFEQYANPVIAGDQKLVHMKYFFTRKLLFVKECDAVALFPGGFGTLDECLEVLTLLQTGKRDMVPVVMLDAPGGDYWHHFQQFVRCCLLQRGMISPADLALYKITDRVDLAVEELLSFYRVYHSMRYVRERLVLRVQRPPGEELLKQLNTAFADVLADGRIELSDALPEEREDQPELNHLKRLVLHFNRRDLGRLRLLIDCLNRGRVPEQFYDPAHCPDPVLAG